MDCAEPSMKLLIGLIANAEETNAVESKNLGGRL